MTNMQQLKNIPFYPVQFVYDNGNDTLPNVAVLKLLHDEDNPGFLGINLNHLNPIHRAQFLEQWQQERVTNIRFGLGEYNLSPGLIALSSGAIRRYNYEHIRYFIYRGNPKGWRTILGNKHLEIGIVL